MSNAIPDLNNSDELKELLENVGSPAELRALLEAPGVDDARIEQFVEALGASGILDRVFALMGGHFVAERAGDEGGVVQWDVDAPGGPYPYHLTIGGGAARGARGPADRPKVTLRLSAPTLLRLCSGTLDGTSGFMGGKIKLSGDMMFGARLAHWFEY